MRVTCHNLDEFLENLEPQRVLLDTIWASRTETPLNGKNRFDATSFRIGLQVSAVVEMEDGGQYILEAGEDCGKDLRDSQPELDGTATFKALKAKLVDFCERRSWTIKPGMVDF